MLSQTETLALIREAQNGSEKAKEKLINENSPLVKSVIKRYIGKGVEYDDLYQLGCLGFIKAIQNFNPNYDVKFSTYVVPMVIGEIKRFMRDDGSVKVSRIIKGLNLKIGHYIEAFEKEHNTTPTIEEISKEFNIDPQEVVFTMDSAKMPISIYSQCSDESSKQLYLIDRLICVDESEEMTNNIILKQALSELNERDKRIILLRFFRDKTQSEIAKELGVSQVQVSRLENKILEKIKQKII